MVVERPFPEGLPGRPWRERVDYFSGITIGHSKLRIAIREVLNYLEEPAGSSLVFVVGPSGVGKSTLIRRVFHLMVKDLWDMLLENPGLIPVAIAEAAPPDTGTFSWKDFYIRCLEALEEPLIDQKIDTEPPKQGGLAGLARRTPGLELRRALEKTLRNRQLTAFFVEEAQHLARVSGGRKLLDQLECVKSLANLTKTLIVLVGTYDLSPLVELNGQVTRRGRLVEFQRYHAESSDDVVAFQETLNTFQKHLPLEQEPDLLKHWEYLFERSVGCIGILKSWLTAALADATRSGDGTIDSKHLQRHALSVTRCQKLASEAIEGERRFRHHAGDENQLRTILGLPPRENPDTNPEQPSRTKDKRRPGERHPSRDRTGTEGGTTSSG